MSSLDRPLNVSPFGGPITSGPSEMTVTSKAPSLKRWKPGVGLLVIGALAKALVAASAAAPDSRARASHQNLSWQYSRRCCLVTFDNNLMARMMA